MALISVRAKAKADEPTPSAVAVPEAQPPVRTITPADIDDPLAIPTWAEKFSFLDWDIDVTSWVQGEIYRRTGVVKLTDNLSPGEYEIYFALVDSPETYSIQLGIAGRDAAGRYKLGNIRILPARASN